MSISEVSIERNVCLIGQYTDRGFRCMANSVSGIALEARERTRLT